MDLPCLTSPNEPSVEELGTVAHDNSLLQLSPGRRTHLHAL